MPLTFSAVIREAYTGAEPEEADPVPVDDRKHLRVGIILCAQGEE